MNDNLSIKPNIILPIKDFFRRNYLPITLIVAALLLGGAYGFGRYSVYRTYPELSGIEKANAILAKVGKLIQLPAGETPTMATINDALSVKETQPFLVSAENGDILFVYANAQEAILYRPSSNKLISVGPVSNSAPLESKTSTTDSSTNDANNVTPER